MSARNRQIYELWTDIQDIIGPANKWPHKIRRNFWTQELKHFDRILTCAFVYVNGLNPEVFLEWMDLMNLARDRAARNHFRALLTLFEAGNYSTSLYAFNITNNRYEYLDGRGTCRRILCPRRFYPLNGSCIPVFTYIQKVYFTVMLEVRRLQKLDREDEAIFYQVLFKSFDQIADGLFKQFTYGMWKMASDYDIIVVSFTTWPNQTTYVDMLTVFLDFLKQITTLKVRIKSVTLEPIIMIAKDPTLMFFDGQLYVHERGQTPTQLPSVRHYLSLVKSLNEMSISSANFCYRVETGPHEVEYVHFGIYINSNTGIMVNSKDVTDAANRLIVCIDDIYNNLTDVKASYMFAEARASGYRQNFNPQDSDMTGVNFVNGIVNATVACVPNTLFAEAIYLCTLVVALISA